MPLLQSLLLTLSLAAFALAVPTNPSPALLSKRDDRYSTGIVPNGVNCATVNEPLHSFDSETLTEWVTAGLSFSSPDAAGQRLFSNTFDASLQLNPAHGISWADGCDPSAGLYSYPISYPGTCSPRIYMNTNPPECEGPITTDMVLFNVEFTYPLGTGRKSATAAKYCAVVTNSEAPPAGNSPAIAREYRQCQNN